MKFGRLPRIYNEKVPKFRAMLADKSLPTPPPCVDYLAKVPDYTGVFYNDVLGCCTTAAVYHAIQIWTANAEEIIDSEPPYDAVRLYSDCCGYVPGDPSTDQGGIEQQVLQYVLNHGAPMGKPPRLLYRHRIAAFVEVNVADINEVKTAIADGGLAYIGFNVPAYLQSSGFPAVWDVNPQGDNSIVGGHAVVLASYDDKGAGFISWGQKYRMSWEFFQAFTDEAYAIADPNWITATGKTPGGLTLAQLESAMQTLTN